MNTTPKFSSTIVGRKIKKKKSARNRIHGEESDPDEIPAEVLPDYIQNRKNKFEEMQKKLGEAGLKLPPDYDDIYFSDDERIEDLHEKPAFDEKVVKTSHPYEDIELLKSGGLVPAPIARWLRSYQVEGTAFLHELFVYQRGGILGDDMGLGKTIQVIAFLTAAFGKTGDERDLKRMHRFGTMLDKEKRSNPRSRRYYPKVLIICPGSLMSNWESELQKWGYWHVYVYHGNPDVKDSALRAAKNGRLEIMITTYTTYRLDASAINVIDWDAVVADECHQIKTRSSAITKAMNEINALCRIGLTGTAIQNKYEELYTLLNWTNPGKFGSMAAWKQLVSEPLKMGQAHDATYAQLAAARKTARSLVNSLLPPFFLRRMKTLIADQLPKKTDRVVFCPLTDVQAEAYQNLVDSDFIEYIRTSAENCMCGSGNKQGWCCRQEIPGYGKWQNNVFPCLAMLRRLANHLALLIPSSSDASEKQSKDLNYLQTALPDQWKDLYREKDSITHYANTHFCGKWKVLRHLLQYWYNAGDKVLIFSHSVRLLKMFYMLFQTTTTYNVSYLDGAMSYADRTQMVNDFNADRKQFVFLISTKAGGVGLNITSANKVVVIDPNWNPAYDLQAQDRSYRIGQTRDVEVFRLVSAGTIEEIVYARQIYKQQQANIGYTASIERRYFKGVQDKAGRQGEIFGLRNMFSYQGDVLVLRDIVNKTNIAEARQSGVAIVDFEFDEESGGNAIGLSGDEENAAMSQIAEMIMKDKIGHDQEKQRELKSKERDPVAAILAGAGVDYTHDNQEVIGASKIEAALSRNALENQSDPSMVDKRVFAKSQFEEDDYASDIEQISEEEEGSEDEMKRKSVRWKYAPPEEVTKRQFCEMARYFGHDSPVDFALFVENMTLQERQKHLDKFYRHRRKGLRPDEQANR